MAAPTVFQDVTEDLQLEGVAHLFTGKKFWVAQRVPIRNALLDDIKANGGEIVLLEKNADYLIADHLKPRHCPPGSISYEFITKSVSEGRLEDPEDHRCGPPLGEAREAGAINRPAKGGRAAYTTEEDRILYKWVKDCERTGGLAGGNEIYKQLEAKHPRHTWQSWRDRYNKQLRDRPPSAFHIPDNAPPSPPSDYPAERLSVPPPSQQRRKEAAPKPPVKAKVRRRGSASAQAQTRNNYTVEQLAATFSSEDWEELYAFTEIIEDMVGHERYKGAWGNWAENQDNQTAEQWQQYYEKVVRPQWLRDPEWKRKQIKKKVERRHDESQASASQRVEPAQDAVEAEKLATAVPTRTTLKQVTVETQKPSEPEDENLEDLPNRQLEEEGADKAHCVIVDDVSKKRSGEEGAKLESSSTARYESPKHITEFYHKFKRTREAGDIVDGLEDKGEPSRSVKRTKTVSPLRESTPQRVEIGTQIEPIVISSLESASDTTPSEVAGGPLHNQTIVQILDNDDNIEEQDEAGIGKDIESIISDDFIDIDRLPLAEETAELSDHDLPPDSPTPRAARHRANQFDTQAILSSPSQGLGITRLPLPPDSPEDAQLRDESRSSSLAPLLGSDASTTQSIIEYRRSLEDYDFQPSYPPLDRLPRPASLSPAPSSSSSTGSGDPDPPLDAQELNDFFDEKETNGFDNLFITSALKRTRMRPGLAEAVLEAWRQGKPLPYQRGIWSQEDDEEVENGDGVALAKLERKHTLDGWGGITERLLFLDTYRYR